MRSIQKLNLSAKGICDPNQTRRDYDLNTGSPLVGLLDNPWYPPYMLDAPHFHNCMEIGVCLCGNGTMSIGQNVWAFDQGAVVVIPHGVMHSQQNKGEPMTRWRYVLVNESLYLQEMPSRIRQAMQRRLDQIRNGLFIGSGHALKGICSTIERMFQLREECCNFCENTEMDALLCLLMAQIERMPMELSKRITIPLQWKDTLSPVLQYVSNHYVQEIRVSSMAHSCAMSESYFRKLFVQIMGMAPLEYVNRYRINRSIILLHTTDETVSRIAEAVGFSSIATYNRNFQKYVGISPAQWRKMGKNQQDSALLSMAALH